MLRDVHRLDSWDGDVKAADCGRLQSHFHSAIMRSVVIVVTLIDFHIDGIYKLSVEGQLGAGLDEERFLVSVVSEVSHVDGDIFEPVVSTLFCLVTFHIVHRGPDPLVPDLEK